MHLRHSFHDVIDASSRVRRNGDEEALRAHVLLAPAGTHDINDVLLVPAWSSDTG
jgi:hypothetical protein